MNLRALLAEDMNAIGAVEAIALAAISLSAALPPQVFDEIGLTEGINPVCHSRVCRVNIANDK